MNPVLKHRAELLALCPPPPAPLSEAELAARPIHVIERGDRGPTVVIVHGGVQGGLGGGPATFQEQEVLAEQGWRLKLVDRPGFGQSQTRGVDDMEADAIWIAGMLGDDGAHLIGHSFGGAESMLAAALRPDAVRSLIMVEPALHALLMGNPGNENNAALQADASKTFGALLETKTPGEYALQFIANVGAPAPVVEKLRANPEAAARTGQALLQARMAPPEMLRAAAETVRAAKIPVLVISGGWSPTFDAVGEIAAELTGGRFLIVPSPNHFVQASNAEGFNAAVSAFLRDAEAARA